MSLRSDDLRADLHLLAFNRVTAHYVPVKGLAKPKTTILMKFESGVLARESRMPVV